MATIVIAFVKIIFVGFEFMARREAPFFLRAAFSFWVVAVGSTSVVLFAI